MKIWRSWDWERKLEFVVNWTIFVLAMSVALVAVVEAIERGVA